MTIKDIFKYIENTNQLMTLIEDKPYKLGIRIDQHGEYTEHLNYKDFIKYLKAEYINEAITAILAADITKEQGETQYFESEYTVVYSYDDMKPNTNKLSIQIYQET